MKPSNNQEDESGDLKEITITGRIMVKVNMTPGLGRYPEAVFSRLQKLDCIDATTSGSWGINYMEVLPEILEQKPDIFHAQWPESALGGLFDYDNDENKYLEKIDETFSKIKEENIKIVWTQHNILPHGRHGNIFFQDLYKIYCKHVDGLIHHSHWGKDYFHETHNANALDTVIRHGAFEEEATYHNSQQEARKELKLDQNKRIFLTIGLTRPYKNLDQLLDCFEKRQSTDDYLVICINKTETPYSISLFDHAEKLSNVRVHEGFMSSEDLAIYARASDAYIFAYGENNLTSGCPHLSQAHGIPQIVLSSPYSEEVMADGGLFFNPEPTIADGLNNFLDQLSPEALSRAKDHFKSVPPDYQWDTIAKQTLAFYHEILK